MGSFNACPMVIAVLELIGLLALAGGKERLHLLSWMQRERAPSRSCTGGLSRADLTVADAENFTLISDLPASWTGVQLELVRPCGQVTVSATQSMEKCVRS